MQNIWLRRRMAGCACVTGIKPDGWSRSTLVRRQRWSCFFDQFAAKLRWIRIFYQAAILMGSILLAWTSSGVKMPWVEWVFWRSVVQPAAAEISPRQQVALAGDEGLAQTQAAAVQETAILPSGMRQLDAPRCLSKLAMPSADIA
jgi:hypothetical protein